MSVLDKSDVEALEKIISNYSHEVSIKLTRDLVTVQNRIYSQLESLIWLQKRLNIKGSLPPLRGWATSPDVLLRLHTHIMLSAPKIVVELGSGSSSIVAADALRQNGYGQLISIEHSSHYGKQTLAKLVAENLQPWVDLRVGELEAWNKPHLCPSDAEKPPLWYPERLLKGIEGIDLLLVDGPPGATCEFARYPALPALFERLNPGAQVWMDDTVRQEEKDICQRWADDYGFNLEYYPLEKGLGILSRA